MIARLLILLGVVAMFALPDAAMAQPAVVGALGHQVLEQGGDSLDAATAAVLVMENSPLFNAGLGAVYTYDGQHELDAARLGEACVRQQNALDTGFDSLRPQSAPDVRFGDRLLTPFPG